MGLKVKEIAETPNPNALKFVLSESITTEPVSFFNAEAAKGHALCERLFAVSGVAGVLLLGDFVTINKRSSAKWTEIKKKVVAVVES